MASHKRMQPSATKATPEEILKVYSGVGKTFRVKFVGSENIKEKGDSVALACLKSLKTAQQQLGYHKPKAVLGLSTKGLSLFDERSKANTRVAISKVSNLTHDPEDICYFGVVVMTSESATGFKLYAFKAEKLVAMQFNQASKELFDLMFRIKEAKKKIRERKDQEAAAAAAATAAAATTPAPKVVAGVEAPPDYHAAVGFQQQDDENPPPVPPRQSHEEPELLLVQNETPTNAPIGSTEERRQQVINEWTKLENELDDIAKDLNLGNNSAQPITDGDQIYSVPDKGRTLNSSGVFSDELLTLDLPPATGGWTNFDTMKAPATTPLTSTPATANPAAAQESISLQLNPFSAQQTSPSTFNSGMSAEFSNSAYQSNIANTASPEPKISWDLLENVISAPQQMPMQQQPQPAYGLSFNQAMGVGGAIQPSMGIQSSQNPFQQVPPSNDLLSSPTSDNFLAFSQPLQPASTAPEPPPGPPPKVDAFADLVTIAKKSTPELTPNVSTQASPPPAPPNYPPKQYVSMNKMATLKDRPLPPVPGPSGQASANDLFGMPVEIPPPAATNLNIETAFGTSGQQIEEVYDTFGMPTTDTQQQSVAASGSFIDNFSSGATTSTTAPTQTKWVGFDDDGQWL